MNRRAAFDVLSRIVDTHERQGRSIEHVEATTAAGDGLSVIMEVVVADLGGATGPDGESMTPETATLTEDGRLRVEFAMAPLEALPPEVERSVTVIDRQVRVTDRGRVVVTLELDIDPTSAADPPHSASEPDPEPAVARSGDVPEAQDAPPAESLAAVRDESVPPYEDTAYLQALYDACETFEEMSRLIEMDVVAETVRRYMIEAGVHDPQSYDTVGPATEESRNGAGTPPGETGAPSDSGPSERLVADGLGLPDGVQLEAVVDAVVESATVYEVGRRLGLERERTHELLKSLDLIDLVLHRVNDGRAGPCREDVVDRIQRVRPAGA
jgi:hypothetical protein